MKTMRIKKILPALCGLAVCGSAGLSPAATEPQKPNIVFILADDMGIGDCSAYNPKSKIQTPNIDRLAQQGMLFTDAHAGAPICVPSRYSLMTGEYSSRTWNCWPPKGNNLNDPKKANIASLLKSAGYDTAMVGKWHLGMENNRKDPTDLKVKNSPVKFGFDTFFGINQSLDTEPYFYVEGDRMVAAPTEHTNGQKGDPKKVSKPDIQGPMWREGAMAPGFVHQECLPLFTTKANDYLQSRSGQTKPFFLYLAFAGPHAPWLPSGEFQGKSKVGEYGDFMMMLDNCVGQVLQTLEKQGLAENTLVIFTSDNGPLWFEKDTAMYDHNSSGIYRGHKLEYYEGGHREPFIARWPGHVKAGSTSEQMVNFADMMSTFADLSGVALPAGAGVDSYSILPALLSQPPTGPVRTESIHEQYGNKLALAYRQGDWKLLLPKGVFKVMNKTITPEAMDGIKGFELYDLKSDPAESKNLAEANPEKAKALFALLKSNIERGGSH